MRHLPLRFILIDHAQSSSNPQAPCHSLRIRLATANDLYVQSLQRALLLYREVGDRHGEMTALGNLGVTYREKGEMKRAVRCYQKQLQLAHEIGNRRGEGAAHWNWSQALDQVGRRDEAISYAESAFKIFAQIKHPDAKMMRGQLQEWKKHFFYCSINPEYGQIGRSNKLGNG